MSAPQEKSEAKPQAKLEARTAQSVSTARSSALPLSTAKDPHSGGASVPAALTAAGVASLSTKDLLVAIADEVKALVSVEVQLAKAEVKADLQAEVAMAKGIGAGALLAYAGIIMLFVAGAFALATVVVGWGAALIVAGVAFAGAAGAAAFGWKKRVRNPLGATRRQVTETMQWAKGRTP